MTILDKEEGQVDHPSREDDMFQSLDKNVDLTPMSNFVKDFLKFTQIYRSSENYQETNI